ncbi:MAG: excinuclease ABC subunit UvrA, partial [Opitutaceae bacterium]
MALSEAIRLRGARQNNLKGFDLDIPLGKYVVVTGLSGAGKSSLVFDTLHAEGQRRYVETFSAYTRQFLDLLPKPRIDSIENIRPSIAIEQTNTVKTSRSTVGTMTELTDYFKVWFSHAAECFDPETGEKVEDDTPQSVWTKASASHEGRWLLIAFKVAKPGKLGWPEIFKPLQTQGYIRLLVPGPGGGLQPARVDELIASPPEELPAAYVVQDRIAVRLGNRGRFVEAVETAMHFGAGEVHLFADADRAPAGRYSRGLHSPASGRVFRQATPALFSFNSPLGACPRCRGFGRVIEIDERLAIPDRSRTIDEGAIKCWEGEVYGESKRDLKRFARRRGLPTDVPFAELAPEQQAYVIEGEPCYGEENGKTWPKHWYGVKGFFRWLEKNTYKMHVRVFLSRYRAYNVCPDCGGRRLQPEALCWKWRGRTLAELYGLPVRDLLGLLRPAASGGGDVDRSADLAFESILTRLGYLDQVGLGYLTLDRPSKTLSGGEVQRVNLTSCLGTSLVDTLFVLDEPSVGLHPRDIDRLIGIVRSLTSHGNTVVVVEHDEAMIRAADHILEIGPEPGEKGGKVVFQGDLPQLLRSPLSLTGAYLSGRRSVPLPDRRRSADGADWLVLRGVRKHNLRGIDVRIPLRRLVCLSGVSGSGKSTLLDHAIHQGLLQARNRLTEDPAEIAGISGAEKLGEIVLVDQSPLSRTPRSNPALYSGAWEPIRELYASTPEAQAAGLAAGSFSFNGGDGRCEHCQGLGCERVEMQFLSDVFVPCPICEGRRFKPEVLAVAWEGRTIADLLETTVADARSLFGAYPRIASPLRSLDSVGLGYLKLGQPLNTLSGGESQRLKLVRYLGELGGEAAAADALLLLDEPTTGLHRHDVKGLIGVLQALVDRGHSVVVIEHNTDVLKCADWMLEIGPEAGEDGGRVVAEGTPDAIAAAGTASSPYLRAALAGAPEAPATVAEEIPPDVLKTDERVLRLTGARENNLKNLSVDIPLRRLNVVTGVSGSGKSTLAFDIVFAEGQRRFMESMSPYARQFVEQLPRPAIDRLTGIPPTVAIEQRVTRGSRKSTVATITEVAQYLRLLYARLGVQHHPETGRPVEPLPRSSLERLLARVLASRAARRAKRLHLCAPLIRGRKGHHQPIADWIGRQGYALMRTDGRILRVDAFRKLDRYREHDIEVVVTDLAGGVPPPRSELRAALDAALRIGKGSCFLAGPDGVILSWFSTTRTDAASGESYPELEPKHFSFNSPRGWCPGCRGHGRIFPWMLEPEDDEDDPLARLRPFGIDSASDIEEQGRLCPECRGERLNRVSRAVRLRLRGGGAAISLPELLRSTSAEALDRLGKLPKDERTRLVTQDLLPQIRERLKFLGHVGLGYLSLDRPTETLSGGEA